MPSTYTVNLGIEKPATGEQSGTWGDTTNLNFDMLDQAINGAVSITLSSAGTSGSPNTLAISDGAVSDGRNKWIEFTDGADLGATAYVQLTPNDAEKIVFIRNSLSGSRSVILFQGTYDAGRDLEVPAGVDMVVKFSGGGATATTTNVFQRLRVENLNIAGTTTVDGVIDDDTMATASATKLATSESIKAYVDTTAAAQNELSEVLANGNTTGGTSISVNSTDNILFGDNNKAIFGAGSDLQIYHDGSNSVIHDSGTGDLTIRGTNLKLQPAAGTEDFLTATTNAEVTIYHNNNPKLATTSTGVDVTGTVTADGLTVDKSGSSIITTLNRSDSTAGYINFKNTGTTTGFVGYESTDFVVYTDNVKVMQASDGGDISFYEDTGTTPKFFWDASTERLGIGNAAPTTTLDVTGTVTADGLTVEDADGATIRIQSSDTSVDGGSLGQLEFYSNDASTGGTGVKGKIQVSDNGSTGQNYEMNFFTGYVTGGAHTETKKMSIGPYGDISFYEDTGTTPKFFWDASAEALGIGTSSPSVKMELYDSGSVYQKMQRGATNHILIGAESGANSIYSRGSTDTTGLPFRILTGSTERMRIDSSGRVGIGASDPKERFEIAGRDSNIRIYGRSGITNNSISSNLYFDSTTWTRDDITNGAVAIELDTRTDTAIKFYTTAATSGYPSEAMRIDASGNLLVGKTSYGSVTGTGSQIGAGGVAIFTASSDAPLYLNRTTSDGTIIDFRKDGTTVGSIGTAGGAPYYAGVSKSLRIGGAGIYPATNTGAYTDATTDIGASNVRWKDLYLSGGVYLGGTGAANKLDDYETGTWTPTNAGAALTVTQAKYTKVGRMVTVACFVTANANTSGNWGGLPFTIDVNGTYSGSVGYQNDAAGETWNVLADGGTSWTLRKGATSEQLLSGNNLRMTLTYFTT